MIDEEFFHIRYEFTSPLGEIEGDRYVTSYFGEVFKYVDGGSSELVGKFELSLMLLGLAMNESYSISEIFDMDEYTFQVGKDIYDFENFDLKEHILDFYHHSFANQDICIIKRFEIATEYRRKGLGKKVMKDIYNRFSSSCGIFIVQAFPLQFEASTLLAPETAWYKKMDFEGLENDYEKAFYQLKSFYQKIGFSHIDGYENYMFLNPSLRNKTLDSISLD